MKEHTWPANKALTDRFPTKWVIFLSLPLFVGLIPLYLLAHRNREEERKRKENKFIFFSLTLCWPPISYYFSINWPYILHLWVIVLAYGQLIRKDNRNLRARLFLLLFFSVTPSRTLQINKKRNLDGEDRENRRKSSWRAILFSLNSHSFTALRNWGKSMGLARQLKHSITIISFFPSSGCLCVVFVPLEERKL